MMNMNHKKQHDTIDTVIAIILVLAMVVPLAVSVVGF